MHSAGRLLASASNDRTVRIWAIDQPNVPCLAVLETSDASGLATNVVTSTWRPGDVTYAALAPPQLLSISSAGLCSVWSAPRPAPDAAEPLCRARFRLAGYGGPAGTPPPAAAVGSWPVRSAQLPVAESAQFMAFQAAWSPGGTRFAVGTTDSVLHVFRVTASCSAAEQKAIDDDAAAEAGAGGGAAGVTPTRAAANAAARASAAGGAPTCVATLRGHRNDVTSVAWSGSGTRLASGSKDGTARLWHFNGTSGGAKGPTLSGRANAAPPREQWRSTLLGTLKEEGQQTPVLGTVAFSCDDALLVTASSVAAMDVWCARSGAHLRALTLPHAQPAHTREVYVFECHPVLGHLGFSVTLPRPPTLTLTLTLTPTPISTPHRSPLTFYPNPNPHPHQASYDGTLVLWDLTSGGALRQLEQPRLDENSEVLDGS